MIELRIKSFVAIDPIYLPFQKESFDAALSCGVLEHVPDEGRSLEELHFILKPKGYLFIYMLPHKCGFYEFIATLSKKSDHPLKYTFRSIKNSLENHGFLLLKFSRGNLFPKNLVIIPQTIVRLVKRIYDNNYDTCILLEKILIRIPFINILSGTLEIIAQKK